VWILKDLVDRGDEDSGLGTKICSPYSTAKVIFCKGKKGIFTQRTQRTQRSPRKEAWIEDRAEVKEKSRSLASLGMTRVVARRILGLGDTGDNRG